MNQPPMPAVLPKLILKADDYGDMAASNDAVNELVRRGLLTTVGAIVGVTQEQHAQDLLAAIDASPDPDLVSIVLHVNFQTGQPVAGAAAVPSLVGENQRFKRPVPAQPAWDEYARQLNPKDVTKELDAQINRFVKLFGRLPDALDSHNIILAVPPAAEIAIQKAEELQLAITYPYLYEQVYDGVLAGQVLHTALRQKYVQKGIPTADHAYPRYFNSYDHPTEALLHAIRNLEPGVTQIVFHPIHPRYSSIATDSPDRFKRRLTDYTMLVDAEVAAEIDKLRRSGQLSSYKQLRQNRFDPPRVRSAQASETTYAIQ